MTVIAIVAATVAVFLHGPLQSYQDAQRRASISDAVDIAFTLIKRDLQTALPNSVRVTNSGAIFYLEFLTTRTGGRYRAAAPLAAAPTSANTCPDVDGDGLANENVLEFGSADTCFTTLGAVPNLGTIAANSDFLVMYNLGPGFTDADAYATGSASGGNKSLILASGVGSGAENVIRFQSNVFALESPGRRFYVVSGPVSYICDPGAGTLRRVADYAISTAQPAPPAATAVLLAKGIAACTISYDQNVVNQREGVVSIWLRFADAAGAASVSVFQQVQVSNEP